MSILLSGVNGYPTTNVLTSTPTDPAAALNAAGSTGTSQTQANTPAGIAGNNSSLSLAVSQALAQMGGGADLSSLLTPASEQSTSSFMSSLLASMQSSSGSDLSSTNSLYGLLGYPSGQSTAPVTLNQSSSTIKLQTSIQNLITQLNGNSSTGGLFGVSPDSNATSGLANLQQSFNSLITSSGGDPSQASLQSFLKTIAANIQSSTSIGSLFDASA